MSILACTGRLRRPFIHLGCIPGGSEHGRANDLGGTSPFYITLKKGTRPEDAQILADWIRGAAVLSRQNDVQFQRDLNLKAELRRQGVVEGTAGALAVAAVQRAAMVTHLSVVENQDGDANASSDNTMDVVQDHMFSEAEAQVSIEVFSDAGSWVEFLERSAVLSALAYIVGSEISEYFGLGAFPFLNTAS